MEGLVTTLEQLREEVEYFSRFDAFAWDTETMPGPAGPGTRGIPTQNRVVWLSMATYGRTIVIPTERLTGNLRFLADPYHLFPRTRTMSLTVAQMRHLLSQAD